MKKLILIVIALVLCAGFASAADYLFVVDNNGLAKDVVDTINTIQNLKNKGLLEEGDYQDTTADKVNAGDLNDKVAVFIINGKATIVVGKDLDAGYMDFAEEAKDSLKEVSGIEADIISSEESSNLTQEEPEQEEETPEPAQTEQNETANESAEQPEENQSEAVTISPPEENEPSIFEKIINWFKSLFKLK
jgi:hypothetical protein